MTLNDLIALNDEIAALVRSGVPLESGLAAVGSDMPGRLGRIATTWAQRTARGEPLDQGVAQDAGALPPAYRAVMQAGMKAGRLSAALETLAATARRLGDTRRTVLAAFIYPLIVFLTAWGGAVFFTLVVLPRLAEGFVALRLPAQPMLAAWGKLARWVWLWGPGVPLVVGVGVAAWWFLSPRAGALDGRRSDRLIGAFPWAGSLLRDTRAAAFLDILALLIENNAPLGEAVVLAGETSGDPRLAQAARQWATAVEKGQTQPAAFGTPFPPLIAWLMTASRGDAALSAALRQAADSYRRRARYHSDMLRVFLPVSLTFLIGGSVTVLFAVSLFVPYTSMLYYLALGVS